LAHYGPILPVYAESEVRFLNPETLIQREASKCVACGLCLPHCPTYRLTQHEAESPRGRLSLMLAFTKGALPWSPDLQTHLDQCLDCRACEKVCPSSVSYGLALVSARTFLKSNHARSKKKFSDWIRWFVEKPMRMNWLRSLLWAYQVSGLQWLAQKTRILNLLKLAKFDSAVPKLGPYARMTGTHVPHVPRAKRVVLFTGCQAHMADQPALTSSIRLLNRLGYEVFVPSDQGCCGALHSHAGQADTAIEMMRRNLRAFGDENEPILTVSSGCAATLREYDQVLTGHDSIRQFSRRVCDINQFLTAAPWPTEVSFRPLNCRIAVHNPCTLTNAVRQEDKPYALLAKIPGATVLPLPENQYCCGAAGSYHLDNPLIANQLRTPKIDGLRNLAPDILVSSNPGCATFLSAGLREAGLSVKVLHPVTLLEQQLD